MGNEVNGVTTINFKSADGSLKSFKTREAKANDSALKSIMENGKEVIYTKVAVKNDKGENEYKYVVTDGGQEVQAPTKTPEKDLPAFCSLGETKYDRTVDSFFDGVLSIDNTKPCNDGKDDGKISGWDRFKHFCKGCLSPIKAIVKHPIKSLAIAAATTVAAIAFPVVGTALLIGGLALGIATLGYGAYKANAAKTDGEARAAWENIGTGTITTVLSAIGLRKAHMAVKAKQEAFPTSAKYGNAEARLQCKLDAAKQAEQAAKAALKREKSLYGKIPRVKKLKEIEAQRAKVNKPKLNAQAKKLAQAKLNRLEAEYKRMDPTAETAQLARKQTAETTYANAKAELESAQAAMPKTAPETTHTPEYTGLAQRLHSVGTKVKDTVDAFKPSTLKENMLPQGKECMGTVAGKNKFDGIGSQLTTRAKSFGFHDVAGKKMSDVEALSEVALKHIHDGHHWQAKDAINYMQQIVKAGKLSESETAEAQTLIKTATTLLGKTKAINTTPGIKTGSTIMGNIENATDHSTTEYDKLAIGAYTLA